MMLYCSYSRVHMIPNRDVLLWKPKQDVQFTVKSSYNTLMDTSNQSYQVFPYKQIWKVHALPRIAFFVWEARRVCILTIDILMRRGRVMLNACYLRRSAAETW